MLLWLLFCVLNCLGIFGGFGREAPSSVIGSWWQLQYLVSQSESEHLVSHSRRLTCFSRTLEEKCIIHLVDWSQFCSLGLIREKVEEGLWSSGWSCIYKNCIQKFVFKLISDHVYSNHNFASSFLCADDLIFKGWIPVRTLGKKVLFFRLGSFPLNCWDTRRRVLVLSQSQSHPCSLGTRLRTIWDEIQRASSESCMNFSKTPITVDSCSSRLFVPFIFMSICCHRSSICDTCE